MPAMGAAPALGAGALAGGIGIAIGLPGMGAGIGTPGCIRDAAEVATAVPVDGWRLEFNDRKVAQPSTRATAAPAASPRLSRRDFWVATMG
jgi:hypothetical protein